MTKRPLTRDTFGIAPLDPKERISLCQRAERMGEMFMGAAILSYEDTVLKTEAERDVYKAVVEAYLTGSTIEKTLAELEESTKWFREFGFSGERTEALLAAFMKLLEIGLGAGFCA